MPKLRCTHTGLILLTLLVLTCLPVCGQHEHETGNSVRAPRIFLDKPARVVEYQLKRLSNEQLLAVERATDDKMYLPVFYAILTREGMSRAYREDALKAMTEINQSSPVAELCTAIQSVTGSDDQARRAVIAMADLLLQQPLDELKAEKDRLSELSRSERDWAARAGYAGLLASGNVEPAWSEVQSERVPLLLSSIALVPSMETRGGFHTRVAAYLSADSLPQRKAAIEALASIPERQADTFLRVADLVDNPQLRNGAIRTLLSVPADLRNASKSRELIEWLVNYAEQTPAEKRTEDDFLDAMQLVDELLGKASPDFARQYRTRLSETVVRVVRIRTVEEEMRYDTSYFAVEAGRPVQVVLINDDLMPHNLVITQPGALKEVAEEGLAVGPTGGLDGKQYVPHSDKVLFATQMIPTLGQERLTFEAPSEPGEYPYVCTFPRHWMRMYGVMVVVEDLDAWLKNPVEPKDPIGSNRSFVQAWQLDDFAGQLDQGLRGRSAQIGEKIFTDATCAQCHRLGQVGVGNVGPELSETFAKYQGDAQAVLREIIDPSHRIDDKYAVHLVLDVNDQTYSGLVVAENSKQIALLENPEAKQPTVILKEDIEQIVKTSNSMMPKGLMDRFSKDEIFELLSFIQSLQKP